MVASPVTCQYVDQMANSMKIIVNCIELHACKRRKFTLFTAKTVSSKVRRLSV
ncbi:hypothetical protein NXF25_005341 [Crotalus adamanteus]|uniref:Uncharacterized protein n=1 Tax=Crotalus adamanteus TaxID=8729 RepID=A0AAW1BX75_CROAD